MKELYVNNIKLDIEESVSIPINYAIEDVQNPGAIKTDYSVNVKIPGTSTNNNVLGQLYSFNASNISKFNPSKKNSMVYLEDGMVVISGYIKVNNIINNEDIIIYECSLHDKTAEFFQSLKDKKMIDLKFGDLGDLKHSLNKYFIKDNWASNLTGSSQRIHDIVKYIPTVQGFYDDFDSNKILFDAIPGQEWKPIEYDYDVSEWEARTFRGNKQKASISVKETIKAILDNSGYKYKLGNFFNNKNPYWNNVFKMCQEYSKIESRIEAISYLKEYVDVMSTDRYLNLTTNNKQTKFVNTTGGDNLNIIKNGLIDLNRYVNENVDVNYTCRLECRKARCINQPSLMSNTQGVFNIPKDIYFETIINYPNNIKTYKVSSEKLTLYKDANTNLIKFTFNDNSIFTDNFNFRSDESILNIYTKVVNPYNSIITYKSLDNTVNIVVRPDEIELELITVFDNFQVKSRTDDKSGILNITTNELFDKEATQFDFLVEYLKVFNLYIQKNNEIIEITDINEFYKSGNIINWDNKIDKSKEFKINPLVFDKNKLLIGYAPSETNSFFKQYKENIKSNYGDKVALTGYDFNKDEFRVLNTIKSYPPLITDNNMLTYSYFVEYNKVKPLNWIDIQAPSFYSIDGSKRIKTDGSGEYFFYTGLYYKEQDRITNYKTCIDDHGGELLNGEKIGNYYTHLSSGVYKYVETNKVPIFRVVGNFLNTEGSAELFSLDIAKPNIVYYDISDAEYPESSTIYSRYWSKFIRDRYNINSKILECTLTLTLKDIKQFKFNDIVYLQGRYWCVQKIQNFVKDKPTKVQLLLINDLNNYKQK